MTREDRDCLAWRMWEVGIDLDHIAAALEYRCDHDAFQAVRRHVTR